MKIGFQMEHLSRSKKENSTSVLLMGEAISRGHEAYHFEPSSLSLENGKDLTAKVRKVKYIDIRKEKFYEMGKEERLDLSKLDVIHMRQEPPFDMEYITATFLLERIHPKTWVINDPKWVRNSVEKFFPFDFPEFIPPTLITGDAKEIAAFRKKHGKIVIKPIYSFGGDGVFLIEDDINIESLTDKMLELYRAPLIAQKYIPEIKEGDKRIVMIDGEIEGVVLKMPAKGSILANTRFGGILKQAEPSKRDIKIIETVGKELKKRGILICGIDIIGDYLTEINVTSPSGLPQLKELYGTFPEKKVWDVIEKKLAKKN